MQTNNTPARFTLALTLALLPLAAAFKPVSADKRISCDSGLPLNWINQEVFLLKLVAEGWSVDSINEHNGCWKLSGTNPQGKTSVAYFDPGNGEKTLVTQNGRVVFRANNY